MILAGEFVNREQATIAMQAWRHPLADGAFLRTVGKVRNVALANAAE